MYGGLILMLPFVWFCMQLLFFQIFYLKIVEMHPVWEGRIPDLSIEIVLVLITFIVGIKLVSLSKIMSLDIQQIQLRR